MTEETDEPKTDINELFSRDPMSLTDTDIDSIIEEMRKKRHLFNTSPGKTGQTRSAAPKKTAAQQAASKLNLDIKL